MRIILSANTSWYLWNFRGNLIRKLLVDGHDVTVVSPKDNSSSKLKDLGCRVIDLPISGHGRNIVQEVLICIKYLRIFLRHAPNVFLGFTVKPVIYGGIAARLCRIRSVLTITGLGTIFIRETKATRLIEFLYKFSLHRASIVFFQNNDDLSMFVNRGLVSSNNSTLVPGSGVDLTHFAYTPKYNQVNAEIITFLMVARLIRDKGICEYAECARIIQGKYPRARFILAGSYDLNNPTSISPSMISTWEKNGPVEYLGNIENIVPVIQNTDCVVLPSYREGMPRTLLEASAIGRPVITTDVPGCREVVDEGVNGFKCRSRDTEDLARRIEQFINLPRIVHREMGRQGRQKMERQFDEKIVINQYILAVKTIVTGKDVLSLR